MTERNLKITFRLDGTGVYYDPTEPPMLDAIMACIRARHYVHGDPPGRDEKPDEIPIPFKKWAINGAWGYHASALFPLEPGGDEQIIFLRRRYRQGRAELAEGSPNLTNGTYRDWNLPLPILLTPALVAYCVYTGDRKVKDLRRDLVRDVKWIGKKRSHGRGRVVGVEIDLIEEDRSLYYQGQAMRYLPDPDGVRMVRTRPPYWNNYDKTACCEIGDNHQP